jgi:hypothetical protein
MGFVTLAVCCVVPGTPITSHLIPHTTRQLLPLCCPRLPAPALAEQFSHDLEQWLYQDSALQFETAYWPFCSFGLC